MASRTKRKKSPGRPRREMTFHRRKVVQLDDGTVGYAMINERTDDCFRAAVATVLQVPAGIVPDLNIDRRLLAGDDPETITRESWAHMLAWLDSRGLRLVYHETLPVTCERWLGVVTGLLSATETASLLDGNMTRAERRALHRGGANARLHDHRHFGDHCLAMVRDRVLFDPATGLDAPRGHTVPRLGLRDVTYGLTFEPTTTKEN